ncbi:MAG TPA: hypothetical protein VGD81_20035 [Opitutaceae bacterium]
MHFRFSSSAVVAAFVFASSSSCALAWDYEGHRNVNSLALAGLPAEFPAFVRAPEAAERIAFLSGEPDRWRNVADLPVRHANAPDHYLDLEYLTEAGLTLAGLSEFRHVYTEQFAAGRAAHPEYFPAIDPEKNKDHTRELVGYLPWAIVEHYGKLKSAFSYLKAFEEAGTPEEIANARANIIYLMGVMGHYVGDGAQPLHTTKHHNGWVGDNPHGYTTWNKFHAWIDGGFPAKAGVSFGELAPRARPARILGAAPQPGAPAPARDPIFSDVLAYLENQHAQVEPLYALDKAGGLKADGVPAAIAGGKAFIEEQQLRGGEMLASLWLTAWRTAPLDVYLRARLAERSGAITGK